MNVSHYYFHIVGDKLDEIDRGQREAQAALVNSSSGRDARMIVIVITRENTFERLDLLLLDFFLDQVR